MRSDTRTLLRNIQAAARIGHAESLWAALENLLDLPQVAGNHPMDELFLNKVILPVGEAIGRSRIKVAALRPLVTHPYAAYRAAAGIALLEQYLLGINGTALKDLNALVQDPRQDVQQAIRLAVLRASNADPEKLDHLYRTWQQSPSPRVQSLAYQILPNLPDAIIIEKIQALETDAIPSQPEVKKTLASTLAALGAGSQAEQVLGILSAWAAQTEPDFRVIAASLSKPWAAEYAVQSLQILTRLASQTGPQKRIRKALQSLYRHGADAQVLAALEEWRNADGPNLQAAGNDDKLAF